MRQCAPERHVQLRCAGADAQRSSSSFAMSLTRQYAGLQKAITYQRRRQRSSPGGPAGAPVSQSPTGCAHASLPDAKSAAPIILRACDPAVTLCERTRLCTRTTLSLRLLSTVNFWSGRRESNPRHSAWEADVLPLNYARMLLHIDKNFLFSSSSQVLSPQINPASRMSRSRIEGVRSTDHVLDETLPAFGVRRGRSARFS